MENKQNKNLIKEIAKKDDILNIKLKLEKSICEIIKEDGYGIGFFSKINYKNNEIYCLLTSNHSITEEMLNKEYIEIKINNKIKKIYLNKKKWTNKDLDYTCIEISKDDDIEILEIDNNCFNNENEYKEYNKKGIIIATINKDKEIKILQDILIYNDIFNIVYHNSNVEEGFSERLILLFNNLKIVGINYPY